MRPRTAPQTVLGAAGGRARIGFGTTSRATRYRTVTLQLAAVQAMVERAVTIAAQLP